MEMKERLQGLIEKNQLGMLRMRLEALHAPDVAELMEACTRERALLVFRLLPKERAAETFAYLPPERQQALIDAMRAGEVRQVMEHLASDDAADFLEEAPAGVVKKALDGADRERRAQLAALLRYPENSAGSLMTADFVELHDRLTVGQALDCVRKRGPRAENADVLYTIDNTRHLTGAVRLIDLVCAEQIHRVSDIRDARVVSVGTQVDQEEVAAAFRRYDVAQMPVVDSEGRLVGMITVDDVLDVIEREDTEDMEIMAAITPQEKPYLSIGPLQLAKSRIIWLLVLMISATISGRIISAFEQVLQSAVMLTAFIPMLMDTGGNCGSQASVMVTRGLALGEILPKDALRVLWKELRVSLIVGSALAAVNFARILLFEGVGAQVALVVSLSLLATVICAKCAGALLPLLAKQCRLDPAVMASPLITTLVDTASLLVYFCFAKAMLGL